MPQRQVNNSFDAVNIPYYFDYKAPSNLRRIQFLNVEFKKKIRNAHIPRIQDEPQFFNWEKNV
jgi:hypothetical protein